METARKLDMSSQTGSIEIEARRSLSCVGDVPDGYRLISSSTWLAQHSRFDTFLAGFDFALPFCKPVCIGLE
jgi:hypothetical protein